MPCCSSEKLVFPDGSTRVISPSRTAFGVLTALTTAAANVRERAEAVELHLVRPVVAVRQGGRKRCEHRLVLHRLGAVRLGGRRILVVAADDQPVLLLAVEVRGHERPGPVEAPPVQADLELPVLLLLEQLVRAVVPDLDAACAVLALRDLAVELRVLERVVLDVHRERAVACFERDALRHRPRQQDAVALEAEVVVQPAGVVSLHDEDRRVAVATAAEGLGSLLRIALAAVVLERHPRSLAVFHRFRPPGGW